MKQKRIIWAICTLLITGSVGAYEIKFRHTLVKMLGGQNNQISLTIKNDGTVQSEFPTFAPHAKSATTELNTKLRQQLNNQIQKLVQAKINPDVQRKLAVVKSKQAGLFYSSESDILSLEIIDDGAVIWSIELDNFHELEYHYDQLGEWQVLVDVIYDLNKVIKQQKQQLKGGEL